jgi:hypothetical protein
MQSYVSYSTSRCGSSSEYRSRSRIVVGEDTVSSTMSYTDHPIDGNIRQVVPSYDSYLIH